MLKRNDLVKQFESVVKQEIINHKNEVLQMNRSMNSFKNDSSENFEALDKMIDRVDSRVGYLEVQNKEIIDGHKKFSKIVESLINDLNNSISSISSKIIKSFKDIDCKFLSNKEFCLFLEHSSKKDFENEKILKEIKQEISWSTKYLQSQVENSLKKMREELEKRPDELQQIEKKLSSKMESFRVDNKGIIEEIQSIKERLFISEKKTENIYTLISKINKKIGI